MEHPKLKVGIMKETEIHFRFLDHYLLRANGNSYFGNQTIRIAENQIFLNGLAIEKEELYFEPIHGSNSSFELLEVTIGVQFHWERRENQRFKGALLFLTEENKLLAINIISLEDYLISVISSEMSATSSLELLKAHAITSRSWLIAQVVKGKEL